MLTLRQHRHEPRHEKRPVNHKRANLHYMEGEEVMCYALGRLVAQVNRICYAAGAFK